MQCQYSMFYVALNFSEKHSVIALFNFQNLIKGVVI